MLAPSASVRGTNPRQFGHSLVYTRPAGIALDVSDGRHGMVGPISGVHTPAEIRGIGQRKKRKLPVPAIGPESPGDPEKIERKSRTARCPQRQSERES